MIRVGSQSKYKSVDKVTLKAREIKYYSAKFDSMGNIQFRVVRVSKGRNVYNQPV